VPTASFSAHFEVDGQNVGDEYTVTDDRAVMLVIETTAGQLQPFGELDPIVIEEAGVEVIPNGADVTVPKGPCSRIPSCEVSVEPAAKVYQPIDPKPFVFGGLTTLVLATLAALAYQSRPVLPKHAALMRGSGRARQRLGLREHQSGLIPSGVGVGSNADQVPIGARQQIGEIRGRWGIPHQAVFVTGAEVKDVKVDGQRLEPGQSVKLSEGSGIQAGNTKAGYSQEKPKN
jgi:hypothetical protein